MIGGHGVVTIGDCRIAYRRAGTEGPPVVLLHGGGIDDAALSWRHAIGPVADDYQVYAPDWPGYGDSDDTGVHSVDGYVSLLEAFLDAVGLESATLVGLSMGGAAAVGFTLDSPGRVDRLVAINSYGLGPRLPVGSLWRAVATVPGANAMGWATMGLSTELARAGLAALVSDPSTLDPAFVDEFRARAARPGAGTAFEAFQRNELTADGRARTDFSDRLGSIAVPTRLIHGGDDPLVPPAWSARAAEAIADGDVTILEGCGHWAPRERPELFTDTLLNVLPARSDSQ